MSSSWDRLQVTMKSLGIEPKKSLGQNFLISDQVIQKIISRGGEAKPDLLIEIGPGPGALTDLLRQIKAEFVVIELDRVLGMEAGFVGKSFLTTDKLNGHYRYGSDIVNLTADATIPGGLGTFGWDDEGVPAQRTSIVTNGIFSGYLMSRDTAPMLGLTSNGCVRADSWNRLPMIRMTNVSLEPGTWTLDELVADTDDGIYMSINKSWSIDDRRLNFQFGVELAFEIKHGKLGRMLKNATYTGITPKFWGSCDAICNRDEWVVWGTPNCGKGEPMQTMRTGHGAAPARFRDVQVGVGRW